MMRKYISMALVAIATFASSACSNEDIQIDKLLTVTVATKGVVEPFTYERVKGELSSMAASLKVRTRLLVYNDMGKKVFSTEELFPGYNNVMQLQPNLPNGTYTMVALTDVVSADKLQYFWTLSGDDELSTLRLEPVKDKDSRGNAVVRQGFKDNLLGVETRKVVINESTQLVEMKPKPAGAILFVKMQNVKKFADIKQLQIRCNQANNYVSFDAQGTMIPSTVRDQGTSMNNALLSINPFEDANLVDQVAYFFVLPCEIRCAFAYAKTNDTNAHFAGGSAKFMEQTIRQGEEYELLLDLDATTDIAVDPAISMKKVN